MSKRREPRVLDDDEAKLVESLAGHTIVAARWVDENPDEDWTDHEAALLTLDDGRVIRFGGWGYDAWGATVSLEKPRRDA